MAGMIENWEGSFGTPVTICPDGRFSATASRIFDTETGRREKAAPDEFFYREMRRKTGLGGPPPKKPFFWKNTPGTPRKKKKGPKKPEGGSGI